METNQLTGFKPLPTNSSLLHTWVITIDGRKVPDTKIRLRNGSAGFLLAHMAVSFDRRVEDIDNNYRNGDLDDWGHAFRAVRGYAQLSRHAYGLAEDLNATDHPLAVGHTFTPRQVEIIHNRLDRYDGCIRWGGDYSGRVDAMHFEIDRNLATCERVARGLMGSAIGKYVLANNPTQRKVILS